MQFTATLPVIGMDIAKHVFQLHVVDAQTGEVTRHKLRRDRVTTLLCQSSEVARRDGGLWRCAPLGQNAADAGT
jgi:hypothetical protein